MIILGIGNPQWWWCNIQSKSYWLPNTQSIVLLADWLILENSEKAASNINMPDCNQRMKFHILFLSHWSCIFQLCLSDNTRIIPPYTSMGRFMKVPNSNLTFGIIPKTGTTNLLRKFCIMIGSDCLEKLGDQDEHDFMVFNKPRFVIHHLQYKTVSTLNSKQQVQQSSVETETAIPCKPLAYAPRHIPLSFIQQCSGLQQMPKILKLLQITDRVHKNLHLVE